MSDSYWDDMKEAQYAADAAEKERYRKDLERVKSERAIRQARKSMISASPITSSFQTVFMSKAELYESIGEQELMDASQDLLRMSIIKMANEMGRDVKVFDINGLTVYKAGVPDFFKGCLGGCSTSRFNPDDLMGTFNLGDGEDYDSDHPDYDDDF